MTIRLLKALLLVLWQILVCFGTLAHFCEGEFFKPGCCEVIRRARVRYVQIPTAGLGA